MAEVKVVNNRISAGGKEISLLSGEIHYWRLNPEYWEHILDRAAELGLNCLCTYIPWHYHETEKGKYDFEGKTGPQKDLVKFLELVKARKFWLIVRPGPYLYTEWSNKGIPDYLVQYHRNSKEFKKLSEGYVKSVCAAIRPYLASSGGNIIMVQAENEVDIWSRIYEKEMGFLSEPGEFQVFLEKKYGKIQELNRRWGTSCKAFSEAKPVTVPLLDDNFSRKKHLDFCEFRLWFCQEVTAWAVAEFRKNGIDVPVSLNTYPSQDVQPWSALQEQCDVFGMDTYPVNEFGGYPAEQRVFLDRIRYLNTFAKIRFIGEFEIGVWQGAHHWLGLMHPNHYRLINASALQAGAAGWNWYMLVNRDNWYFAPINERGNKRMEMFPVFQDIVKWYRAVEPADCERQTETGATHYLLQDCSSDVWRENPALQALYDADIDYDFFDVETGKLPKKVLFYANRQFMSRKAQENLLKYVENGGTLVLFQDFPRADDDLQPLNVLNIKEPDRILEYHSVAVKLGMESAEVSCPLFVYDSVPGEKIAGVSVAMDRPSMEEEMNFEDLQKGLEYTIGYMEKRGKGSIVVVGVRPNAALMLALHKWLGVDIPARSLARGVTSSLLKRKDGKYFLIVTNNTNEQKYTKMELSKAVFGSGNWKAKDLLTGETSAFSPAAGLSVPVERKDGAVFELVKE